MLVKDFIKMAKKMGASDGLVMISYNSKNKVQVILTPELGDIIIPEDTYYFVSNEDYKINKEITECNGRSFYSIKVTDKPIKFAFNSKGINSISQYRITVDTLLNDLNDCENLPILFYNEDKKGNKIYYYINAVDKVRDTDIIKEDKKFKLIDLSGLEIKVSKVHNII